MARQNGGVVAAYAEAVRCVGREFDAPVADVHAAWEQLAGAGFDTDSLLVNGLNHPGPEAHRIPAELLMRIIDPTFRLTILDDLLGN